ncbi:hypothetical protein Patl1_03348 [Pistacia atlantica]|uniref:Uncharacterized protein n=1 Tax=Pistacia atlantica TaxID=434234 RepID=A0ACC1CBS3_9ROSI|nr:hypothetical protein Patl1_03348 [Pistacia atlantica]
METLVVVAQHKNQYYGRVKPNGSGRSRNFRDVNCRAFESGAGILPTPIRTSSASVTKRSSSFVSFNSSSSSKTPSSSVNGNVNSVDNIPTKSKTSARSNPIAINMKTPRNERPFTGKLLGEFETLSLSELWAGPAYSNSPPPSSLPIPKFSMQPKRTVSLDLPVMADEAAVEMDRPMAKSAPSSPTRDLIGRTRDIFLSADSATKTLRRILNLDNWMALVGQQSPDFSFEIDVELGKLSPGLRKAYFPWRFVDCCQAIYKGTIARSVWKAFSGLEHVRDSYGLDR